MASILPLDELNRLNAEIRTRFGDSQLPQSKADEEDVIDELLDLFLLAYAMGNSLHPHLNNQCQANKSD